MDGGGLGRMFALGVVGLVAALSPNAGAATGVSARTGRAAVVGRATAVAGTLDDASQVARWYFEYRYTAYGMTFSFTSPARRASAAAADQPVSAVLKDIAGGRRCRYRLVVQTRGGSAVGRWRRFTTSSAGAPPPPPSLATPATVAMSQQAAVTQANGLLGELVLPPDATVLTPPPPAGALAGPPLIPGVFDLADQDSLWQLTETPSDVFSFLKAHPPAGSTQNGSAGTDAEPVYVSFAWPSAAGLLNIRWLVVGLAALSDGLTGVRADAQVQWIAPRPAGEVVPAGVHEVDITRPRSGPNQALALRVTQATQVSTMVSLIDELPTTQPGIVNCPARIVSVNGRLVGPATIAFTFYASAGRPALASASELADVTEPTTSCEPLDFSLDGTPQTPLLEGAAFLEAVQQLLGVPLATAN
jgi:hypothetical protein